MSRRLALALLWLAALLALAWLAQSRLQVGGDLRLFMPSPKTPEQRLLLQQFGEGPGARVLLLAIEGADAPILADVSRGLRARLADEPAFRLVANGDTDAQDIPETLMAYRYLLSPALDAHSLDAGYLRDALQQRVQDLGSPAAALVEPWIARDPTLETLALVEHWQPRQEPERAFGVWFSPDRVRALLLVETAAPGFDPDAQQQALATINEAFDHARSEATTDATDAARSGALPTLEVSGPGAFSVLMRERTQGEATLLGGAASAGLLLLLAFAYRSLALPLLGALPLASAALAGLAAVALLFGGVHGITIAFGITLIGVAQDYPVHLFSHHRPGRDSFASVRGLWRTLATGAGSTCIAYLSFLAAGVEGLAQLATFTITGLATAALTTRFALPALLPPARRDVADGVLLRRVADWVQRLPRPRVALAVLAAAAIAVLVLAPQPWWENSLAALTPVPPHLLERDQALRAQLGAPDVRHVLVIEGDDIEKLLVRGEQLQPRLQSLVDAGAIAGFDLASRYLPSAATQLRRQARLPAPDVLRESLASAQMDSPFRAGVFAPFLDDVERARTAPPLRPADLADTPLGMRLAGLLVDGDRPAALVALNGVADTRALRGFAQDAGADVHLLDLREASESLAGEYRQRVVLAMLGALLLLAAAVWLALREPRRVLRVLAPMLLTTLLVLALLHGSGVALTLFHLVALILGAGLGLDYALFVDAAGGEAAEQRRTLHALVVCAASTLMVFGLLALSQIPVLRAIGSTVALCIVGNLVLALLLARADAPARTPA